MKVDDNAELARTALEIYRDRELKQALAKVDRTQMRTVHAAFAQAGSIDEQEIVLRYQAGRFRDKWDPKLVERLLKVTRAAGEAMAGDSRAKAELAARQLGFIVRLHTVVHAEQGGK
ncbi:MAG: hypothetical protein KF901_22475 [Myxococcales bacterium]|nr:hypothetical protein [Myxococcales bacterium]